MDRYENLIYGSIYLIVNAYIFYNIYVIRNEQKQIKDVLDTIIDNNHTNSTQRLKNSSIRKRLPVIKNSNTDINSDTNTISNTNNTNVNTDVNNINITPDTNDITDNVIIDVDVNTISNHNSTVVAIENKVTDETVNTTVETTITDINSSMNESIHQDNIDYSIDIIDHPMDSKKPKKKSWWSYSI